MTNGGIGSDLLRMLARPFGGGGPKKVRVPVSIYGKLPIYKDFIRRGFADNGSQAFKHWLDQGFSRFWENESSCHERTIDPHLYVLRFAGTGRTILGYLWGSHDMGGLRRFPFSFFVSLSVSRGNPDLRGLLTALGEIRAAAEAFRSQAASMSGIDAFYQRFREIDVELTLSDGPAPSPRNRPDEDSLSVAEFASSLWGEQASQEWPAFLGYLSRHLGEKGRGHHLALRIPRSTLVSPLDQVELACSLAERIRPGTSSQTSLLLPLERAADGLVLLGRELRPDDILLLNPDKRDLESIDDLRAAVPRGAEPTAPLAPDEGKKPLRSLFGDAGA